MSFFFFFFERKRDCSAVLSGLAITSSSTRISLEPKKTSKSFLRGGILVCLLLEKQLEGRDGIVQHSQGFLEVDCSVGLFHVSVNVINTLNP